MHSDELRVCWQEKAQKEGGQRWKDKHSEKTICVCKGFWEKQFQIIM